MGGVEGGVGGGEGLILDLIDAFDIAIAKGC